MWLRQPIIAGVGLIVMGVWFDAPYRASIPTQGWDVPVRGRVVRFEADYVSKRASMQAWFEYTLDDGREGRGVLHKGGRFGSRNRIMNEMDSYKVGSRVRGYANPEEPTEAVILRGKERPVQKRWLIMSVAGVPFLAYGLMRWGIQRWGSARMLMA